MEHVSCLSDVFLDFSSHLEDLEKFPSQMPCSSHRQFMELVTRTRFLLASNPIPRSNIDGAVRLITFSLVHLCYLFVFNSLCFLLPTLRTGTWTIGIFTLECLRQSLEIKFLLEKYMRQANQMVLVRQSFRLVITMNFANCCSGSKAAFTTL